MMQKLLNIEQFCQRIFTKTKTFKKKKKLGQPLDTKTTLDGRNFLGAIFAIFGPKVGEILSFGLYLFVENDLKFKIQNWASSSGSYSHLEQLHSPVHTHASGTCPHSFGWCITFK
jgi:hypothetical protein